MFVNAEWVTLSSNDSSPLCDVQLIYIYITVIQNQNFPIQVAYDSDVYWQNIHTTWINRFKIVLASQGEILRYENVKRKRHNCNANIYHLYWKILVVFGRDIIGYTLIGTENTYHAQDAATSNLLNVQARTKILPRVKPSLDKATSFVLLVTPQLMEVHMQHWQINMKCHSCRSITPSRDNYHVS